MQKTTIGLLLGGKSDEHVVSIMSAVSVLKHLDKKEFEIVPIGISRQGHWICLEDTYQNQGDALFDEKKLEDLILAADQETTGQALGVVLKSVDVVFPVLHGPYGEDGTVQGLCDMLGVPYVGAKVRASSVCMDKAFTKRILKDAGVPVTPWVEIKKADFEKDCAKIIDGVLGALSYPLFVKPANLGSSVGISKVKEPGKLKDALDNAFCFDTKLLIEEGIECRELECAILGNHAPVASCVGEIIPAHEFYDYEAKYFCDGDSKILIPADVDPGIVEQIRSMAVMAYRTLDITGLARVDFFLDKKNNQILLNEINTMPGFTKFSMYPLLWSESGLGYSELLTHLVRLAQEIG